MFCILLFFLKVFFYLIHNVLESNYFLWNQVHDKFDLMHETLFLMVELLDRALSMIPVKKSDIQLVGLTALLLASKYEDFWHPKVCFQFSLSCELRFHLLYSFHIDNPSITDQRTA